MCINMWLKSGIYTQCKNLFFLSVTLNAVWFWMEFSEIVEYYIKSIIYWYWTCLLHHVKVAAKWQSVEFEGGCNVGAASL